MRTVHDARGDDALGAGDPEACVTARAHSLELLCCSVRERRDARARRKLLNNIRVVL